MMIFKIIFLLLLASSIKGRRNYYDSGDILTSSDPENSLIGDPVINCGDRNIEMRFNTKSKFVGKVFVRGHYNTPECRIDYAQAMLDGTDVDGIKLSHGACDMDRQRILHPGGLQFSTILVISFHPLFITKQDRAFNINCVYRESEKTVSSQLEVAELATESIAHDTPAPTCTYTIRKNELNGEIMHVAKVGDVVVHRWECDSEAYGMLVHSCYVEDGQGGKHQVVDDKGCHTDKFLLGSPTYVESLTMAYRESFVFMFADKVSVRFLCQLKLCIKENGGCNGITPPVCAKQNDMFSDYNRDQTQTYVPKKSKRNVNATVPDSIKAKNNKNALIVDLYSNYVYVVEDDGRSESAKSQLNEQIASRSLKLESQVCFDTTIFSFVIGLFVFFAVLAISLIIFTTRTKRNF
uniref:ZP domain-containing protein n=1 Tax=Rhabditophanes sp. KR3021 TaxID=114890 RepID=A0AC35U2X4_9BILA